MFRQKIIKKFLKKKSLLKLLENHTQSTANTGLQELNNLSQSNLLYDKNHNFSRYFFCVLKLEWTYLSKVILTEECPNISLKDFISIPTSIQLDENVCLNW